ncbi:MAG TPA: cyclic pyranopterin monophosphate synthase MoaC [Clostridiales bacterium]|nr:cyclic pyranopterin monophosphate synthase MoaC [Clostridiales bacterium]
MNRIPILSFAGYSGTGKTTLIERLLPLLIESGLRVAVIKHDVHDFDIDREGKDSWRFTQAGAAVSAISSPEKAAFVEQRALSFSDVRARITDVDLILVEGYKSEDIPQIGLERQAAGLGFPDEVERYIALVTDADDVTGNPAGARSSAYAERSGADNVCYGVGGMCSGAGDVHTQARRHGIPVFGYDDIDAIAAFVLTYIRSEKNERGDFTHFDEAGRARMVDVGAKGETRRTAKAAGRVLLNRQTYDLIASSGVKKGDVLTVAQIAGIMGAKRTSDLIPMCHPIAVDGIDLSLSLNEERCAVDIEATVRCSGRTGVEMEALTAVSVAALTVYDMCKAVQRDIGITEIRLLEKTGGVHGDYVRKDEVK